MADMTVEQLIDEIEVYIDNCRSAGMLGGGSMIKVNREEILTMLDELHDQLPRELAQSREIIKARDTILDDARARADKIMESARQEAGTLVGEDEIVKIAQMRADTLLKEAQDEADALRTMSRANASEVQTGALQYAQNILEGMEYMYKNIIKQEREYFDAVIQKLEEEHRQILDNKHEIDMQLGAGPKGTRTKEDFEKKKEE
ncbi:MAG: hypothetical protein IJH71_09725 [Eubacterium sp.]|nr:hypothetical protein [Eubacterium sp.]